MLIFMHVARGLSFRLSSTVVRGHHRHRHRCRHQDASAVLSISSGTGTGTRHTHHGHHSSCADDNDCVNLLEEEIRGSLSRHLSPIVSQDPSKKRIAMIVGVSGGCDSIGLLHGLVRSLSATETNVSGKLSLSLPWQEMTLPCSIHVVHFDHELRGLESDGDRIFVQQLCNLYKLPFHCYYWKKDHADATNTSFSQDAARIWRRSRTSSLLQTVVDHDEAGFILTAHHADDSAESLLLKLLRGTHITNINGMDPVTRDTDSNWIIRPLLNVRKNVIIEYLKALNLDWREDSSNASDKYLRNQVRNKLMPLLSDMVGGEDILQRRLNTLSRQSEEVRIDLQHRVNKYLQESCSAELFALPSLDFELVHKEALHAWVMDTTANLQFSYGRLERVCEQLIDHPHKLEWTMSIGYGYHLKREGNRLRLLGPTEGSSIEQLKQQTHADSTELTWTVLPVTHEWGDSPDGIKLCMSTEVLKGLSGFFLSTVRKDNLVFAPPWRKDRSPSKVAQFLRGQQVPLFERREAQIVYALKRNGEKLAVAVKLPTTGEIVVNALVTLDQEKADARQILVALPH